MSLKKLIQITSSLIVIICGMFNVAHARKSVFIISRHSNPSKAQVYSIEGGGVVYQDEVDISGYNQGFGAVGNAVWPEKELMFVTYDTNWE